MHIAGKWFAGIAILLIVASTYFTTKLLDLRAHWQSQIEQRQQKLEQTKTQLADAERRVRELENTRLGLVRIWGDAWDAPRSNPQAGGAGRIEIGIGTDSGLAVDRNGAARPAPHVHVFETEGGPSRYMGEFLVAEKRADRALGQMVRVPYPGEVEQWRGGSYRIRESLPGDWLARFADLEAQILVADSNLKSQLLGLELLAKQTQDSQSTLNQRMAELNGNSDAPEGSNNELRLGLVQSLRNYEQDRNTLLAEVHQLRRDIDSTYFKLQETLQLNDEKARQLYRDAGVAPNSAASGLVPQAVRELPALGTPGRG